MKSDNNNEQDEDPQNPRLSDGDLIGKNHEYDSTMTGLLIKAARLESGLSQKELADNCGMEKSIINEVETGKLEPNMKDLRKIVRQGLGGRLYLSIRL